MAIKLFFFDMEGTLYDHGESSPGKPSSNMWRLIAEALGEDAIREDDEDYARYHRGEFNSYFEWAASSAARYKRFGLRREQFMQLVHTMKYNEGVPQTIKALHEKGIKTAIITGSFSAQAGRAQRELKIPHAFCTMKLFWNDQGLIEHWNILPGDEVGKADFVELLRKEYKFTKDECAFIGDGKNDVHIAQHVGTSFAYNAHPDLKKVATHSIEHFSDVLKFV